MVRTVSKALIKTFWRKEQFEPDVTRAFRITVALVVPLIVAHYVGKPFWGVLPAITAQLLTSAKIEGTFAERTLLLLLATIICATTGFVGTLAAFNVFTALVFLGIVTGLACMARGIGDYGQIFGLSGVILSLICLHPPNTFDHALINASLIAAGGGWAIVLSALRLPLQPNTFSLAIAKPWYLSSQLMRSLSYPGWLKKNDIWLNQTEIDLRKGINNILPWVRKKRKKTAPIRREVLKLVRASSRLGVSAITLHHEFSDLFVEKIPIAVVLKIKKTAESIGSAGEAITDTILSTNKETYLIAKRATEKAATALHNLEKTIESEKVKDKDWIKLLNFISLFESSIQYLQDAMLMLERIMDTSQKKPFTNSSDLKLRYKRAFRQVYLQFQPGSLLLKHSLRMMTMATLGYLIYYLLDIPRGYWIVLTIVVLLQPEFGNTWERARDRMIGTLFGGLVGSFILINFHSSHFIFLIVAIAVSAFLFSFFQAKRYRVSVVFVTIMLVLMLDITEQINWTISAYRLLSTVIGGLLAIAGAYLLWPDWDSLQFPYRISKAIQANKNYLLQIGHELEAKSGFHARVIADRRKAEIENINVEDALKRIKMEPYRFRRRIKNAQDLADLNKKLTRAITTFSSYLPRLKSLEHFPEAHDMIDQLARALDTISMEADKNVGEVKGGIEMSFLVLDAKIDLLRDSFFEKSSSTTLTHETRLLPYQIISTQLKRIAEPIKEMLELTEEDNHS